MAQNDRKIAVDRQFIISRLKAVRTTEGLGRPEDAMATWEVRVKCQKYLVNSYSRRQEF